MGAVTLRMDLAIIVVVIGITRSITAALALLIAVLAHELGHFVVARLLGGQGRLVLQVGSGRAYLKGIEGTGPSLAVLIAGGLAGLVPFTASLYLGYFGGTLWQAVVLWTAYQWLPFPSLDGGQILARTVLRSIPRTLTRWRLLWAFGTVTVLLLIWLFPPMAHWWMYFTVMALLLGRSEAGPMRYADAYAAWEAQDYRAATERALAAPRYLTDDELEAITLLGLDAARALDDPDAIDALADALPPHHPERIRAAEYLLRKGHPEGPVLAKMAFDAFDRGRVSRTEVDDELWADLAFHFASVEAGHGRSDSALALLERAESFGFDHVDRLEADPQLGQLGRQPRYQAVVERMQARLPEA